MRSARRPRAGEYAIAGGRAELVCVYEVREGKIQTASFVFGARVVDPGP